MEDQQKLLQVLEEQVWAALDDVIDPEIQMSVVRGNMIHDLKVGEGFGSISLTFRPTTPDCPIAVHLATQIKDALLNLNLFDRIDVSVDQHKLKDMIEDILNRMR